MEPEEAEKRLASSIQWCQQQAADHAIGMIHMYTGHSEDLCESEIEKTFLLGWLLRLEWYKLSGSPHGGTAEFILYNPDHDSTLETPHFDTPIWQMDQVYAQFCVGEYRADFLLRRAVRHDFKSPPIYSPKVIVECDGHDFHERTKEQAARDKERDRILQTQGFYVLRFTGSEVYRNPAKCVEQVDEFLEEHISRTYRELYAKGRE
jgi:very-short-patch-repair endonuclease